MGVLDPDLQALATAAGVDPSLSGVTTLPSQVPNPASPYWFPFMGRRTFNDNMLLPTTNSMISPVNNATAQQPTGATTVADNNTPTQDPTAQQSPMGLLSQLGSGWDKSMIGPSLLALAQGIGTGPNIGAGLAQGFGNINQVMQQRLHDKLALASLVNSLQNQQAYLGIAKQNAEIEKAKSNQPSPQVAGSVGAIAGIDPNDVQKSLVIGAGGPGFNQLEWASGKGAAGDANLTLRSLEDARRKLQGLPPASEQDYVAALPGAKDDDNTIAAKYNKLFGGITRAYDASTSSMPDYQQANEPLIAPYRQKITADMVKQWRSQPTQPSTTGGTTTATEAGAVPGGLSRGTIKRGWRFMGGDPSDRNNWERAFTQ